MRDQVSVDREALLWLLSKVKKLPVSPSRDFYEEEMLERLEKRFNDEDKVWNSKDVEIND
jgi:uncharacterized Fe-S cluster-containing radical SAM superfamily protein